MLFRYVWLLLFIFNVACVAKKSNSVKINFNYLKGTVSNYQNNDYPSVKINSSEQLIELLKSNNLWEFTSNEVSLLLIKNFPKDFKKLRVKDKKRAFFHSMIPMILVVFEEIKEERRNLLKIIKKYPKIRKFSDSDIAEFNFSDKIFIKRLTRKYGAITKKELLKRVDILPISLVLSQTAIESA